MAGPLRVARISAINDAFVYPEALLPPLRRWGWLECRGGQRGGVAGEVQPGAASKTRRLVFYDAADGKASRAEGFEHVRSRSNSFFVLPGHQVLDVEQVIEANERFLIVAKIGAGERLAEALDPRTRTRRS